MKQVSEVKTIAELNKFMKAESFSYTALYMQSSEEGDLEIVFDIHTNNMFLECITTSFGVVLPVNLKLFTEKCAEFLENLDNLKDYQKFRKHVFGHLDGKDLCVCAFSLYNRKTDELAGEVIWNDDNRKLDFMEPLKLDFADDLFNDDE